MNAGSVPAGAGVASLRALPAKAITAIKVAVFFIALIPFARLAWQSVFNVDALGANPIEHLTRATGWWTLFFLAVTLAITPARKLFNLPWLLKLRRMLGLFTFFYVALHFTTYIWWDQWFDVAEIVKDVIKRPFITVGFAAFVLLIPLAATSFNAAIRFMGGKRWQLLHRAVYATAVLGVLHFWWHKAGKNDLFEPLMFALVFAALLGWRLKQRLSVV
ncbi:sulfite oxidase heme-binding subunit YedZ [Piscinibacterium candidicorallinum]|uniref:Protein-methionine-sulfoxide reductase heme-binding subunit MsrQ n=1 Tax=Piscinibacterium candidicorallinum TaxID=1793872 RepID=A0ABV7H4W1_9BURK